ncbi:MULTISPECIES: hypothetical protein [unclassified Streptomyces]|uniref:hypothetical protein n=1 Tax=unclassified Streptomyces TaxID=2593676 RepID=UPI00332F93C7
MDPRDIGEARRRLLEAASAVDPVGMPLHHRELLVLQCQPAFHEGRFDEATTLSARPGEDPEGVGGQDRARLEIPRNRPAFIAEGRAGAVVAMERLAKEARESGNVELSSEIWRAVAESLAHVNGVTAWTPPGPHESPPRWGGLGVGLGECPRQDSNLRPSA